MPAPSEPMTGVWYDPVFGHTGRWEDTPGWMFWKPVKRRLVIPPHAREAATSLYEYQHPAFVAREIMEKTFGPTKAD